MAKLAINNGTKLLDTTPRNLPWPPRNEETAEKLKELYMSGQWSFNSPMEQEFENNFDAYHGAKYGIFMANGTTTLECSLAALGVGPGDEVIVPALTWMATALAASYVGAVPVIVDVEPDTLCMDPVQVRKALTPRTKAIIPVHVYGSMANLDELLAVGEEYNLPVVEDCAHMHGGFWRGRGVGSWGKVGSFSFQQSKTLASGEGGICITNDPELAEKIYLLKHIGYARGLKQGQGVKAPDNLLCHNYRGTAFQALILNEQLKTLDERMKIYESNVKYLASLISDIDGFKSELDIFWAKGGGHEPCELIQKYGKKLNALHLKDMDVRANPLRPTEYPNAIIGEGQCGCKEAYDEAKKLGVTTFILEVEDYPCPYDEYLKKSCANIKAFED